MQIKLAYTILLALICTSIFSGTKGQLHFLKFVRQNRNPYIGSPQLSSNSPPELLQSINIFTQNAESLCAYGIWALYSKPSFGQGSENSTTVIPILSNDLTSCTKIPGLGSYQSAAYLGNKNPLESGMVVYNLPNFLGDSVKPTGSNFNFVDGTIRPGFKLGSMAITGKDLIWLICGEDTCSNKTSTVCVNMSTQSGGTLFMGPNSLGDRSIKWPAIVVRVKTITDLTECAKFPNPSPPPSPALEVYTK